MYECHWNLHSDPFEIRFESDFYYPSESHQAALLKLRYAIEHRRGAAVLCGVHGMGKTLLIQSLREQLPEFVAPIANIVYPAMEPSQLIRSIAYRLDQQTQASSIPDLASAIDRIESILRENIRRDRHALIIIDEAQLLEQHGLLEPLRLLLNLASDEGKGESNATIVLCGQPTLLPQIQRHAALDDRIGVRCILNRFNIDETVGYIGHRIRAAGGQVEQVFDTSALEQCFVWTQGVPRRINRLCDLALMIGFAQECDRIDARLIDEVQHELTAPALSS